ncbi:MAG TPA: hypothetical protein DC006_00920 [Prevotellaceae bacterium]|nr:hypothetical protein [Prevotellaceae bacterium]HBE55361.1 hypothetical protein [Prevotellaceae bacterium]
MTDREIRRMQQRIDEGIRLAHRRLWKRAGHAHLSLVVYRDGKVVEVVPDGDDNLCADGAGDPLARRNSLR